MLYTETLHGFHGGCDDVVGHGEHGAYGNHVCECA